MQMVDSPVSRRCFVSKRWSCGCGRRWDSFLDESEVRFCRPDLFNILRFFLLMQWPLACWPPRPPCFLNCRPQQFCDLDVWIEGGVNLENYFLPEGPVAPGQIAHDRHLTGIWRTKFKRGEAGTFNCFFCAECRISSAFFCPSYASTRCTSSSIHFIHHPALIILFFAPLQQQLLSTEEGVNLLSPSDSCCRPLVFRRESRQENLQNKVL